MRFCRMITTHTLEDAGHLLKRILSQTLLHYGIKRFVVRLNTGRQPQSSPAESAHLVSGSMLKALPPKARTIFGK